MSSGITNQSQLPTGWASMNRWIESTQNRKGLATKPHRLELAVDLYRWIVRDETAIASAASASETSRRVMAAAM